MCRPGKACSSWRGQWSRLASPRNSPQHLMPDATDFKLGSQLRVTFAPYRLSGGKCSDRRRLETKMLCLLFSPFCFEGLPCRPQHLPSSLPGPHMRTPFPFASLQTKRLPPCLRSQKRRADSSPLRPTLFPVRRRRLVLQPWMQSSFDANCRFCATVRTLSTRSLSMEINQSFPGDGLILSLSGGLSLQRAASR